jgi:hypothetical protein
MRRSPQPDAQRAATESSTELGTTSARRPGSCGWPRDALRQTPLGRPCPSIRSRARGGSGRQKEGRIRAHVLLCWLALLLVRLAETHDRTRTWRRIREQLQTLHLGQFTGNAGIAHQRTELTADQRDILSRLQLPEPPRFLHLHPATD